MGEVAGGPVRTGEATVAAQPVAAALLDRLDPAALPQQIAIVVAGVGRELAQRREHLELIPTEQERLGEAVSPALLPRIRFAMGLQEVAVRVRHCLQRRLHLGWQLLTLRLRPRLRLRLHLRLLQLRLLLLPRLQQLSLQLGQPPLEHLLRVGLLRLRLLPCRALERPGDGRAAGRHASRLRLRLLAALRRQVQSQRSAGARLSTSRRLWPARWVGHERRQAAW